ncbi:MAG: hypothetical protein AAFY56_06875, partial [Pseudomonadota bacterium]
MKFVQDKLVRPARKLRFNLTLNRLNDSGDAARQQLYQSIQHTLDYAPAPEETMWIDRIEKLRGEVSERQEPIVRSIPLKDRPQPVNPDDDPPTQTFTLGEVCKRASKSPFWSFLLFQLVRQFRPQNGLELGTCVGIS